MKKTLLALGLVAVATGAQAAPPAPSIEVTVTGEGAVTSDPASIDCREDSGVCTSKFSRGDAVTLTATPDANANFVNWGGACEGTEPVCTLNLKSGTKTVSATFETPQVTYPAAVQTTGQMSCWDAGGFEVACEGTGQDGESQTGVKPPSPRFVDNGDGTVTDNMTGLSWLKNANCIATNHPEIAVSAGGRVTWQLALDFVAGINNGTYSCGVSGQDWRLPNVRELQSLGDYELSLHIQGPALPIGHPFENVYSSYWTSTSLVESAGAIQAFWVSNFLSTHFSLKNNASHTVITVRGGQ